MSQLFAALVSVSTGASNEAKDPPILSLGNFAMDLYPGNCRECFSQRQIFWWAKNKLARIGTLHLRNSIVGMSAGNFLINFGT